MNETAEQQRFKAANAQQADWKKWGPYLSERAWGTVREDYSAYGAAWDYFPHDQARSRAYQWNEDGLAGICDRSQYLCFALALWNGRDPILKERLFGLGGPEGNHGEDVKECYFYLDSTPTHSYMKMLYKYPQAAFPYTDLVVENRNRGKHDFEYELLDTGVFEGDREPCVVDPGEVVRIIVCAQHIVVALAPPSFPMNTDFDWCAVFHLQMDIEIIPKRCASCSVPVAAAI